MAVYSTSERTRQALIEAAGQLLAERGVTQVSTRAIAERAGENLGTIHYHFGGKEGLLTEVLRFACRAGGGQTLPEVLNECEHDLDRPTGQIHAIRRMVEHLLGAIFSPARPSWCARVLYQVVQHTGPLRVFLREQLVDPYFDAITRLVLRIRPEWTQQEVYVWAHMVIGPVVFHADHAEIILERLGTKAFPDEYLAKLQKRLADDATRALGLDPDPA